MRLRIEAAAPVALVLAGCTGMDTAPPPVEAPSAPERGACDAAPAQNLVGEKATPAKGAAIIEATGATRFQWVLEGSPVTTDYAPNRVRVVHDRAMEIVAIYCG